MTNEQDTQETFDSQERGSSPGKADWYVLFSRAFALPFLVTSAVCAANDQFELACIFASLTIVVLWIRLR